VNDLGLSPSVGFTALSLVAPYGGVTPPFPDAWRSATLESANEDEPTSAPSSIEYSARSPFTETAREVSLRGGVEVGTISAVLSRPIDCSFVQREATHRAVAGDVDRLGRDGGDQRATTGSADRADAEELHDDAPTE
jgi:hypothetical protein